MKFIFLIILGLAISAFCNANAWELPKVGVEGAIQDMQIHQAILEHSHKQAPVYIRNSEEDIVNYTLEDMQRNEQANLRAKHPESYAYPTSKEQMRAYAAR